MDASPSKAQPGALQRILVASKPVGAGWAWGVPSLQGLTGPVRSGWGSGLAAGLGAVFHQGIGIPIRYFSTELKRNGYDTTTTPPFGGGNLHLARLASMQSITSFELSVASLDPALVTVPSVPIVHSSVTLPARFGLRIRAPS